MLFFRVDLAGTATDAARLPHHTAARRADPVLEETVVPAVLAAQGP